MEHVECTLAVAYRKLKPSPGLVSVTVAGALSSSRVIWLLGWVISLPSRVV